MADIVNLNRFRKERARDDKAARAEENRAKFGRTKSEKQKAALEREKDAATLDGAKRDPDPSSAC